AAQMWDSVASDLFSAASAFQSVVWGLTVGSWIGSSAGLMVAVASPYVAWMSVTAGQAELTAAQVRVAAAAYEPAYGLTVPPPVIAENRAELMILIATNLLGQNTPAIAVNEADYVRMWLQAATTMATYQAVADSAVRSIPDSVPPPRILKSNAQSQHSSSNNSGGADPVDDFIAEILKIITGGRVIWDPEAGTVNGLPYDAYTNPGTLMWWIAR
ncbi:PPE family protein, partial [Neisseria meningitidis]|nr:PPE family protein [Neisseria meningitidis]